MAKETSIPLQIVTEQMGTSLRLLRIKKGLSQSTLAKLSGIARPNIVSMETGNRIISVELFERLLKAMGLSITIEIKDNDITVTKTK